MKKGQGVIDILTKQKLSITRATSHQMDVLPVRCSLETIKPISLRFISHALAQKELICDYSVDMKDSSLEQFSHTKLRLLDAYHKHRT